MKAQIKKFYVRFGLFLIPAAIMGLNLVSFSPGVAYADCAQSSTVQSNCIITNYIKPTINFLSAGVGIVIVAMIIVGGIQYSSSGGNPQAANDGRKKIVNALIALLAYSFMYAFLNFLIPGGIVPV